MEAGTRNFGQEFYSDWPAFLLPCICLAVVFAPLPCTDVGVLPSRVKQVG